MKKPIAATVCSVVGTILLALVIVVCIPLTVPRIAGYQIYTVISGSMEPEIPTGSLVYVKNTAPSGIEKGDVIAFYGSLENGSIITHRVVSNNSVSGEFVTKGDANAKEDMEPVSYENFLGKGTLSVPMLGGILAAVVTVPGKIAAGSMILLALVLHVIAGKLKGSSEEDTLELRDDGNH